MPPVEELLNLVLPAKQSLDTDMDPCKGVIFDGDIVGFNSSLRRVGDDFDVRDTFSEPRVQQG